MRFTVVGADKETGSDIELAIVARDRAEAEQLATTRGVLVCSVEPVRDPEPEPIALSLDDEGPQTKTGTVAGVALAEPAKQVGTQVGAQAEVNPHAGGTQAIGAVAGGVAAPHDSILGTPAIGADARQGSVAGADPRHGSMAGVAGTDPRQGSMAGVAPAHAEYHVIMNQSLYLMEVAVNKHMKEGWIPQGGLCVGISNNAMQYFQAMVREKP